MVIFISILCGLFLWMLYEVWRAPDVNEEEDGSITYLEEPKRLRDLFKK